LLAAIPNVNEEAHSLHRTETRLSYNSGSQTGKFPDRLYSAFLKELYGHDCGTAISSAREDGRDSLAR